MNDLITRIHPDLPLCWEDPETLRIGFERARARIRSPSAGAQRFIGRLVSGVPGDELLEEARRAGLMPPEARRLLDDLAPALLTAPGPPGPSAPTARPRLLRTILGDDGREPPGLRDALIATGLCTFDGGEEGASGAHCELAVHVERFLEPLERAQRWLIEEVPHLLVRFTDGAVQVGPLVGARGRPCHSCISLGFLSRDPAYPVLAAQLSGRTPRSETAASAHMAAAFAALLIREWLSGAETAHVKRFTIPVHRGLVHGAPRIDVVSPHGGCGCALSAAARPPRRSATADERSGLPPPPPRAAARRGPG
ncbi:hypothetical protein [Leucobacter sp.]